MPQNRPSGRGTSRTSPRPRSAETRRGRPEIRLRFGFVAIAVVVSLLGVRLLQLQGVNSEKFATLAAQESTQEMVLPATRGEIVDRNGDLLAGSVDGRMIVANPQETSENAPSIARLLTDQLGLDYVDTLAALRNTSDGRQFVYLARRVAATKAETAVDALAAKGYQGVTTRSDPLRDYPQGDVAANLVGFMGIDNPAYGMESTFNTQLSGKDGHTTYQTGAGYRIPQGKTVTDKAVNGETLTTTLDARVQWYAQRALAAAVRKSGAISGTAVVMATKTGETLALADYPTYDASNPLPGDKENFQPRSLTDPYEPGSVEKVLTFASLLDAGKITPRTRIVVPSELRRQDRPIGDWFDHGTLRLTAAGALAKSSNIGTVLAADKLSTNDLMTYLTAFGLGTKTGAGFADETRGIVPSGAALTDQVKDRITFGQSISVNALQMTAAINTVANKGEYVSPSLVQGSATMADGTSIGTDHVTKRRAVSSQAAAQTARMMERVITQNPDVPHAAAVPGYRVAGKTGTAQRVNPETGRYDGSTSVSFAGFAPADDPQITVYVVLHDPAKGSTGGGTAGPTFSKILGYTLSRYDVARTNTPPSRLPLEW